MERSKLDGSASMGVLSFVERQSLVGRRGILGLIHIMSADVLADAQAWVMCCHWWRRQRKQPSRMIRST